MNHPPTGVGGGGQGGDWHYGQGDTDTVVPSLAGEGESIEVIFAGDGLLGNRSSAQRPETTDNTEVTASNSRPPLKNPRNLTRMPRLLALLALQAQ